MYEVEPLPVPMDIGELPRREFLFFALVFLEQSVDETFAFRFITHQLGIQRSEDGQEYQRDERYGERDLIEPETASDADAGDDPHGRCRRQTADSPGGLDDGSGSQETDALNHKRCDARRIGDRGRERSGEDAADRHGCGTEPDKGISPHAGRLSPDFAFDANQAGQHSRQDQTYQDVLYRELHKDGGIITFLSIFRKSREWIKSLAKSGSIR